MRLHGQLTGPSVLQATLAQAQPKHLGPVMPRANGEAATARLDDSGASEFEEVPMQDSDSASSSSEGEGLSDEELDNLDAQVGECLHVNVTAVWQSFESGSYCNGSLQHAMGCKSVCLQCQHLAVPELPGRLVCSSRVPDSGQLSLALQASHREHAMVANLSQRNT